MGVESGIKNVAGGAKDFGWGTVKGAARSGWKGLKNGFITSIVIGVALGMTATGLGAPLGVAVAAGVLAGGVSVPATATWGASIGAAWGTLFGGTKELKKSAQAKNQNLEVGRANIEYKLAAAKEQNAKLKSAATGQNRGGQHGPNNGYGKYQMPNHLAEGNEPNKFTSQFEARENAQSQPVVGGRGGK